MKPSYTIFYTGPGWMGLLGSSRGLLRVFLPQASHQAVLRLLGDFSPQAELNSSPFGDLPSMLRRYLSGELVDFPYGIDLTGATPFQRSVWQVVCSIPYGETRSYAWVAQRVGKPRAVRAVGQALGQNPLPIVIPCHRVVAGRGIGGFSGGPEMKRYLLEMEAAASLRASEKGLEALA